MKKSLLLPFLSLVIAGCANEATSPEPSNQENPSSNYLTVSILCPKSAVGRDGEDITQGSTPNDNYQDGTEKENKVNMVRFFFFDEEGNAANVSKQAASNSYLSYIDWYPENGDQKKPDVNTSGTVEKIVTATLGINKPKEDELPKLVLAVLNPSPDVLQLEDNPSLEELRTVVSDYYTGLTDYNFVITNSVYVDQSSATIDATHINTDNFQATVEEANAKPLYIYVERVLARLDLSINIADKTELGENEYIYQVSTKPVDGTAQDIYVKFLGWNVTATTTASRLIKSINPSWPDALFGEASEPWNIYQYHRSFWGINPKAEDFGYNYGTFNVPASDGKGNYATALTIPAPGEAVTVYLQENAEEYDTSEKGKGPANPTKVILAAQLVDAEGKWITIAHWANRYYTYDGVRKAMANSLNLYQKESSSDQTTFSKIPYDCLDFVPARQMFPDENKRPADVQSYYVYAQLNDKGKEIEWYNGNTTDAQKFTTEQANEYILNRVNYALVWNSGLTYYYFDIQHLGAEGNPGFYGVVRNHLYLANVSAISGFGTPVFEPDQVIYPERPDYDNNVLTAEIRILQWRVVSQDYELTWP